MVTAWCADLTENLSGYVGTIEVPGERGNVNIQPGHEGNAIYDSGRDGQLQPSIAGTPEAVFYNLAMLPGWQKWMPTYRFGTITGIDGDYCNVDLLTARSSQRGMNVNQSDSLANVPIEYMICNGAAFAVGDGVIVEFEDRDWSKPKVIGFSSNPKPCGEYVVVSMVMGAYALCFVWNAETGTLATDVTKNDGNPTVFPCNYDDISNWMATRSNASNGDLYARSDCGVAARFPGLQITGGLDWNEDESQTESESYPADCGISGLTNTENSDASWWDASFEVPEEFDPWQQNPTCTVMELEGTLNHTIWNYTDSLKYTARNGSGKTTAYLVKDVIAFSVSRHRVDQGINFYLPGCEDTFDRESLSRDRNRTYLSPIGEIATVQMQTSHVYNAYGWTGSIADRTIKNSTDFYGRANDKYSENTFVQVWGLDFVYTDKTYNGFQGYWEAGLSQPGTDAGMSISDSWDSEVRTRFGFKVNISIEFLKNGTAGVDPTQYSSNPILEQHCTTMYNSLRTLNGVADDQVQNFGIGIDILK